jgi:hypothetical protein
MISKHNKHSQLGLPPLKYKRRNSDVVGLDLGRDSGQDQVPGCTKEPFSVAATGACIVTCIQRPLACIIRVFTNLGIYQLAQYQRAGCQCGSACADGPTHTGQLAVRDCRGLWSGSQGLGIRGQSSPGLAQFQLGLL